MRVAKVADVVGGDIFILSRPRLPQAGGALAAILTGCDTTADSEPGPSWTMTLEIGENINRRKIKVGLEAFLSANEYKQSFAEPLQVATPTAIGEREVNVFLFRDKFFLTERLIKTDADHEEVTPNRLSRRRAGSK
jgi:hypothetical protein